MNQQELSELAGKLGFDIQDKIPGGYILILTKNTPEDGGADIVFASNIAGTSTLRQIFEWLMYDWEQIKTSTKQVIL